MTFPRTVSVGVEIDWDNDGSFTQAYDDVSEDVLAEPGLTIQYGRDQARSLSPPMISACDFALNNESGRYSPENAASPLNQLIKPGRAVRVFAYQGERRTYDSHITYSSQVPYRGVARYPMFVGNIDTLRVDSTWGQRAVTISALGRMAMLKRKTVSVALQTNIQVNTAIALVLDAAGWTLPRIMVSADTVLDVWWVDERTAWDVILELLASEGPGGMIWETPDGTFYFESRTTREFVNPSTDSQATFYDASTGLSQLYTKHATYDKTEPYRSGLGLTYIDLRYDPRWEDVIDRATVRVKQRALQASTVIWELGTSISLNPSEVRTIWARPQDPFLNAVTPVLTTDYTVSGGAVTVGLSWDNGAVAVLTLTATSGAPTVSDLQLRAQPFVVVGETTTEAMAAGAPSGLDARTYEIKAWPELDPGQADGITQAVVDRYGDPPPRISITVVNGDYVHAIYALFLEPTWRITIENRALAMSTDVWIEQITRHFGTGGLITTTYGCERTIDIAGSGASLWDDALWDAGVWSR